MSSKDDEIKAKVGCGLFIIVILGGLVWGYVMTSHQETVHAMITGKTVKRVSKDSDQYLVFTDVETFRVCDSMWMGQFDSSDMYGKLQEGKRYQLRVYGYRVPFFSMYRNIFVADEVTQ